MLILIEIKGKTATFGYSHVKDIYSKSLYSGINGNNGYRDKEEISLVSEYLLSH
jgi:hypothetical protein